MKWNNKHIGLYLSVSYISFWVLISILSMFYNEGVSGNVGLVNIRPFHIFSQFLGTNHLGQNLLDLIIKGAKYSLLISFCAAVLAVLIGVFIGGMAGYFGDNKVEMKTYQLVSLIISSFMFFYFIHLSFAFSDWNFSFIALLLGVILSLISYLILSTTLRKMKLMCQYVNLPIDILNTKLTEMFFAVPSYFIILSFSPILGDSVWSIVLLLGITSWPQSALLMRAEMLKIREMNYIDALNLSGLSQFRILVYHAIPNAIRPILVNFVFLISGLLVIESTLSFIGIGFSSEILSWGKVIASFKHNSANWWIALFPGVVICLTILSFHRIGKYLEGKFSSYSQS